jgi:MoxR-like ATPase
LGASEAAKKYIKNGASPRAAQAIITAAKVRALVNGNFNVSYEDIEELAYPVLRHRLKTNFNAVTTSLVLTILSALLSRKPKRRNYYGLFSY